MSLSIKYTTPACIKCKKNSLVDVPLAGLRKWQGGSLIQEAFPTLSADEREVLMTGIHPQCWDDIFGGEED